MTTRLIAGDAVNVRIGDTLIRGRVRIASPNGRALIMTIDRGAIGDWTHVVPLFCDRDGRWTTADGVSVDRVWRLADEYEREDKHA